MLHQRVLAFRAHTGHCRDGGLASLQPGPKLDQLLLPLVEIFSLLTFDFFDLDFIVELAFGAWEWTLFAIQPVQNLILVTSEYLGRFLHINLCLYRVLFGQVSSALENICDENCWNKVWAFWIEGVAVPTTAVFGIVGKNFSVR